MKVQQEGYQRGPIHIGKMVVTFRAYAWTNEQLENYKKLKDKELFDLLGDISSSVQGAMEALGEELFKYLKEAEGETQKEKEKEEKKTVSQRTFAEKFFGDFYTSKGGAAKKAPSKKQLREDKEKLAKALGACGGVARFHTFNCFHLFKKSHRMPAW